MAKRFLVFQHMDWEGPGVHLLRSAEKLNVELEVLEIWRQEVPGLASYNGLIVLGGSPNVDQEHMYPFLRNEKTVIRQAIERDKSYFGFCLGHQLLADALSAQVGQNFRRSVGFIEGQLTQQGRNHPIMQHLPDTFPLFKWHAQAVMLPVPEHVEILVRSPDCQVEAISVKGRPHIVGLQFDNHAASRVDAAVWLEGDRAWLAQPPQVDPAAVITAAERLEGLMGMQFEILFENFIKIVA